MAQKKEKIEVLYALTDKKGTYSKFVGTSICSMFENTESMVRVHIFHDGTIKSPNRQKFEALADRYGQEIVFYNVRKLQHKTLREAENIFAKAVKEARYTEAALYRLLAPQVLPEEVKRLIYLDADTIVHIDINELWQEEIADNGMAAVFENDLLKHYGMVATAVGPEIKEMLEYWETLGVKIDDGFNSGVLLMDLEKLRSRENILLSGLRVLAACDTGNNFHDQNILNFHFAGSARHLPWNFNILQPWDREFKKSYEPRGIYHYMGRTLKLNEKEVRDTLFYDYFLKSPWSNGKFICHFYKEMENIYLRYMDKRFKLMRKLVANAAGKKIVVAASTRKRAELAKLLKEPENVTLKIDKDVKAPYALVMKIVEMKKKEEEDIDEKNKKKPVKQEAKIPEGVTFFSLGEEINLNLNLPYDVDSYFYLFFVADYIGLKIMLEQAGLPEEGHYMDGSFLIEEKLGLGGVINPTKAFEIM